MKYRSSERHGCLIALCATLVLSVGCDQDTPVPALDLGLGLVDARGILDAAADARLADAAPPPDALVDAGPPMDATPLDAAPLRDAAPDMGPTEARVRLSYVKATTPPGGVTRQDLLVYDFIDEEAVNLTAGTEVCNIGTCKLSGDMAWMGWLEPGQGAGFQLWLAPVDIARGRVRFDEKRNVGEDVNTFEFARAEETNLVVYSRGQAQDFEHTIEVYVEPVGGESAACDPVNNPAQCQALAGLINTNGGFRVTPFAPRVILIKTTPSTLTLQLFDVSNGLNQTLYTFGMPGRANPLFSGLLPVGLSPDATYIAIFTNEAMLWRAHTLQARPVPPAPDSMGLFESARSPDKCSRMMPFNFTDVIFNPVFSASGDAFYILARGDCAQSAGMTNRDDFDILRFDRDLSGDPVVVTRNVRASHWSNHDIADFDVSRSNDMLAFTASRPNNATSRSIWIIDPQTREYDCSGTARRHIGIDGIARCEFIYDDADGAQVTYHDLRFHDAEVEIER
jgi:hypothetical protein